MKRNRKKQIMNLQNTKVLALYIRKSYLFLFVSLLVSLSLYVYFLFASLYGTALSRDYQFKITELNSEISELENAYVLAYENLGHIAKNQDELNLTKLSKADKTFIKADTFLGRAD